MSVINNTELTIYLFFSPFSVHEEMEAMDNVDALNENFYPSEIPHSLVAEIEPYSWVSIGDCFTDGAFYATDDENGEDGSDDNICVQYNG